MMRFALPALLLVALAGCQREGRLGVNLPRYPGSSYMPRSAQDLETATVYRGDLHTPDAFRTVLAFYVAELGQKPGWRGPNKARDVAIWTNGNMTMGHRGDGEVLDASKPGAMVMIMDSSNRTVVRLVESIPRTSGS